MGDQILSPPVEFDRAWNTGKNGCKFTEITFVFCLIALGIIPVIPTQFEGGIKFYPPGWILPVKFDRAWNIGKNGCKFTEITFVFCLIKLGIIPVIPTQFEGGIKFYPPGWIQPVKFDRAWNIGKNGCKFTEIPFVCLANRIGYHPSDSHPIWGGDQILSPWLNFTGQIRPGMEYW